MLIPGRVSEIKRGANKNRIFTSQFISKIRTIYFSTSDFVEKKVQKFEISVISSLSISDYDYKYMKKY